MFLKCFKKIFNVLKKFSFFLFYFLKCFVLFSVMSFVFVKSLK